MLHSSGEFLRLSSNADDLVESDGMHKDSKCQAYICMWSLTIPVSFFKSSTASRPLDSVEQGSQTSVSSEDDDSKHSRPGTMISSASTKAARHKVLEGLCVEGLPSLAATIVFRPFWAKIWAAALPMPLLAVREQGLAFCSTDWGLRYQVRNSSV